MNKPMGHVARRTWLEPSCLSSLSVALLLFWASPAKSGDVSDEVAAWLAKYRQAASAIPADLAALVERAPLSHAVAASGAVEEIKRLREIIRANEAQIPDASLSLGRKSRMFEEFKDTDPWKITTFANEPMGGPQDEITLATGEVLLGLADMTLPARGGLAFEFRRTYRSYRRYSGPLGEGWDHNHNQRLVLDANDPAYADHVEWHTGGACIVFSRREDRWDPPPGVFARLSFEDGEAVIRTRAGLRLVFKQGRTPLIRAGRGRNWRLEQITTLHRNGDDWANTIQYTYHPDFDRLVEVRDVFGQTITFRYDAHDRLTSIQSPLQVVRYSYEEDDTLVRVDHAAVALSHEKASDLVQSYSYLSGGKDIRYLAGYTPIGGQFEYQYEYEVRHGTIPRRLRLVRAISPSPDNAELAVWTLKDDVVEEGRVVVYRPPAPSPETWAVFKAETDEAPLSAVDLRLPMEQRIPGRAATWRFTYNQDGLPVEVVSPTGRKTLSAYADQHLDPLMRANLLAERDLPAIEIPDWPTVEHGIEQKYHDNLPLPVSLVRYEISSEGKRNDLVSERWRYNAFGDVVYHAIGDEPRWSVVDNYGETSLEIDGTGVVNAWERFESFPAAVDAASRLDGGGLVAREVLDADPATVLDQARKAGLDVPDDLARRTLVVAPVQRTTTFSHDERGYLAEERHPDYLRLLLHNKFGQALGEYDTRSDLSMVWLDTSLRMTRQASRFATLAAKGGYEGESLPGLRGLFHVETFHRDARGLLTRWGRSQETFEGKRPEVRYTRHPDGSVFRRQTEGDPALVTQFDFKTGLVTGRHLEADAVKLPLVSQMAYDAEANLVGFSDGRGLSHSQATDPFGRPFSETSPDGVRRESWKDGAGRLTRERVLGPTGQLLDEGRQSYDLAGRLARTERRRLVYDADGQAVVDEWLVMAEQTHDAAGRVVRNRSVHNESSVTSTYDGLGRVVVQTSPGGDRQINVFENDDPVVTVQSARSTLDDSDSALASFRFYDKRRSPWLEVPVPAAGPPAFDRAQVSRHDTQGRVVMVARPAQSMLRQHFNSFGEIWRTEESPADERVKADAVIRTAVFAPSGRKVHTALENHPLALIETKDGWRRPSEWLAERVSVPQVRRFVYDGFGRLSEETNPDGLTTRRIYGDGSLVREIQRSRDGITEALRFEYDHAQRVTAIQADGKVIQGFTYDHLGRLIRADDQTNPGNPVVLHREYDSMGNLLGERLALSGQREESLPSMEWTHDLVRGVLTSKTVNAPKHPLFWHQRTTRADGQGRIRAIDLDGAAEFVRYDYAGVLPIRVTVPSSGLAKQVALNPYREVGAETWTMPGSENADFARFRYHFDQYGRTEAHDLRMPQSNHDVSVTHLHAYDYRGQLSAQGNPQRVFETREDRMRPLDPDVSPSAYLEAGRVTRSEYDQAGNRIRDYVRTALNQAKVSINPEGYASVTYLSPALPFQAANRAAGLESARASSDMASDRLGSSLAVGAKGNAPKRYAYDPFGRMTQFPTHQEGQQITWKVQYDRLGRVIQMDGTDEKGQPFCRLEFASDVFNRRVLKIITRSQPDGQSETITETTVYDQMEPLWVRRQARHEEPVWHQYLWGAGQREAVMAVLPRDRVEPGMNDELRRYYLHQNRQLSVFASTTFADGKVEAYDVTDYSGFGESATFSRIEGIRTRGVVIEQGSSDLACRSRVLDLPSSQWNPQGDATGARALLLDLRHGASLAELTIWCGSFPESFRVFVVEADHPDVGNIEKLIAAYHKLSKDDERIAAIVENRRNARDPDSRERQRRMDDPYRLALDNRHGQHILILWEEDASLIVREIEVKTNPQPSSSLAFAAAWRDEETGLLYQGARYRLTENGGVFISPDPLGFIAGHNLYAYANNDPLTYFDPDGEAPHMLAGAAVGAGLGAGFYAWQVWRTDEEWNRARFWIYTGAGALSGAAASVTFGAATAWAGSAGLTATKTALLVGSLSGAAGGGVHGLASGFGITLYETGDVGSAIKQGGMNMLVSGGLGAVGGLAGGAVLSKAGAGFWASTLSGSAGAGAAGGISGGVRGAIETRSIAGAARGASIGFARGAALGGAIGAAGHGVGRAAGLIKKLPQQPDNLPAPRSSADGRLLVRTRTVGTERQAPGHHVKPLALGGSDHPRNVIPTPAGHGNTPHPVSVRTDPYGTLYY